MIKYEGGECYDSVDEIPWYQEVLAQAKADLAVTPPEYLPTWYKNWSNANGN